MVKVNSKYKWSALQKYRDVVQKICGNHRDYKRDTQLQIALEILSDIRYGFAQQWAGNLYDASVTAWRRFNQFKEDLDAFRVWLEPEKGKFVFNETDFKPLAEKYKYFLRPAGSWLDVL